MAQKVLIVDDTEMMIKIYVVSFQNAGFEVIRASNGGEALLQARNQVPDLIMLDVMMPDMDGIQVLQELKKDETTKNIKVIMLSANDDALIFKQALDLGAQRTY
jgi:CheY-like chemotaxis protein